MILPNNQKEDTAIISNNTESHNYIRLLEITLAQDFVKSAFPRSCLQEAPSITAFVSVPGVKVNFVNEHSVTLLSTTIGLASCH